MSAHVTAASWSVVLAELEQQRAQGAQERQAQAEEEARLAFLTSQAGMKLTLTQKVLGCCNVNLLAY